ncbi:MAG: hypothetical protein ABUK01_10960 [Leptospirales bacterium]
MVVLVKTEYRAKFIELQKDHIFTSKLHRHLEQIDINRMKGRSYKKSFNLKKEVIELTFEFTQNPEEKIMIEKVNIINK